MKKNTQFCEFGRDCEFGRPLFNIFLIIISKNPAILVHLLRRAVFHMIMFNVLSRRVNVDMPMVVRH
jgi:hypothetical protein